MNQAPDQEKPKATMDEASTQEKVLEALEQAATAVGVVVRYDKLATGDVKSTSGICKIRGVDTVIIDRRLPTKARIAALARELAGFQFDDVYLPPAVRDLLESKDANGQEREKA